MLKKVKLYLREIGLNRCWPSRSTQKLGLACYRTENKLMFRCLQLSRKQTDSSEADRMPNEDLTPNLQELCSGR